MAAAAAESPPEKLRRKSSSKAVLLFSKLTRRPTRARSETFLDGGVHKAAVEKARTLGDVPATIKEEPGLDLAKAKDTGGKKRRKSKWKTLSLKRNKKKVVVKDRPRSVHLSCRGGPPVITAAIVSELKEKTSPQTAVFGLEVEEAAQRLSHVPHIPAPLSDCILFLDAHGLDDQGLYRIPGNKTRVDYHRHRYDAGLPVSIHPHEDPATAASLLLLYLREIPGSLFTKWGNNALRQIDANNSERQVVREARRVVELLPRANQECLRLFFQHLHRVQANSDCNMMTAKNIALCVFPTSCPISLAIVMIVHCDEVFDVHGDGSKSLDMPLAAKTPLTRRRSVVEAKNDNNDEGGGGSAEGDEEGGSGDGELERLMSRHLSRNDDDDDDDDDNDKSRHPPAPNPLQRQPSIVRPANHPLDQPVEHQRVLDLTFSPRPMLRSSSLPDLLAFSRAAGTGFWESSGPAKPSEPQERDEGADNSGDKGSELAAPGFVGASTLRRSLWLVGGLSTTKKLGAALSAKLARRKVDLSSRRRRGEGLRKTWVDAESRRSDDDDEEEEAEEEEEEEGEEEGEEDEAEQAEEANGKEEKAEEGNNNNNDDDDEQRAALEGFALRENLLLGGVLDGNVEDLARLEAPLMGDALHMKHLSVAFS